MTGNNFLKHPPHRNVGDMPYGEYNLLRFQMEAAKIPYVKRVFTDGVLEVWRIYGNSFKVKWVPTGDGDAYFVIRYKDSEDVEKVLLLNKVFVKVVDKINDAFPTNSAVFEDPIFEWKINDDMICFLVEDPDAAGTYLIKFYSIVTGTMHDYSFTVTTTDNAASVVHKWNMFTQPLQPYFFNVHVENEVVYIANRLDIDTITPTKDDDGTYSFVEDSYSAPSAVTEGATTYNTHNLHFEDDELFLLLEEQGQIGAYPELNGISVIDKTDGSVVSTHIRSGIDGIVTPDSDDNRYDVTNNYWLANLPFGSPASGLESPPASTIVRAVSTVPNVCIYENLTYAPFVDMANYKGVELYTYDGEMFFSTTDYPTLYVHTGHLLVTTTGYWKGFTEEEEEFRWLKVHALDDPPEDGAVIHDYMHYNGDTMTEEEIKTKFLIPSDANEIISISYMPGIENSVTLPQT